MENIPKTIRNVLGETHGNQRCLKFTGKKSSNNNYIWLWECLNCGNIREEASGGIIYRKPKYCNSCRHESKIKHGHSMNVNGRKTRTYRIWGKMISRAHYKHSEYLKHYHDVSVCDKWVGEGGFENFLADMGECPSNKHSLNRIRGAKIYSDETCEWVTDKVQKYDQKRKVMNKTGVTGVVWREAPRSVWQANMKCDKKWERYYYGDSYNDCVVCRVISELLNFSFSRTLEDFSKNGVNEICIKNGIDLVFWEKMTDLHKRELHETVLEELYIKVLNESIEYKQDLNLVKDRLKKGELNVQS